MTPELSRWPLDQSGARPGQRFTYWRLLTPAEDHLAGAERGITQLPGGDQIAWLLCAVRYVGARAATGTAVAGVMVRPTAADLWPTGAEAAAVAGAILYASDRTRRWQCPSRRGRLDPDHPAAAALTIAPRHSGC
jgi:hypothetical protein